MARGFECTAAPLAGSKLKFAHLSGRTLQVKNMMALLPEVVFRMIFLHVGSVYPSGLAPSSAVYGLFKAAGAWVRRHYLLRACDYGGGDCRGHCVICGSTHVCVRPKGHLGRCVCFPCYGRGVEHWFPGLRLCSMCHSAIRGVVVTTSTYEFMHWGCYRYSTPPSHSSDLLPEFHSSCISFSR